MDKVKELYGLDLHKEKLPRYNQDGTMKRNKKGEILYSAKARDNAADAILLGHIFLNK